MDNSKLLSQEKCSINQGISYCRFSSPALPKELKITPASFLIKEGRILPTIMKGTLENGWKYIYIVPPHPTSECFQRWQNDDSNILAMNEIYNCVT